MFFLGSLHNLRPRGLLVTPHDFPFEVDSEDALDDLVLDSGFSRSIFQKPDGTLDGAPVELLGVFGAKSLAEHVAHAGAGGVRVLHCSEAGTVEMPVGVDDLYCGHCFFFYCLLVLVCRWVIFGICWLDLLFPGWTSLSTDHYCLLPQGARDQSALGFHSWLG